MRLRRTIAYLALLALLLVALSPVAGASWECEGRTCGTTPWFCCCDSPAEARDGNCGTSRNPAMGSGVCETNCGCVMVAQDTVTARLAAASTFPGIGFVPALIPTPVAIDALLPTERVARSLETRGPPPTHRPWLSASLRAPPVA